MAISQISALTVHISFLLSVLNIWQTRSWQIYPLHQTAMIDSYSERPYLEDQVLAVLPPTNGNFTDS